ncbi:O-antigen ligase family protein [Tsuneonella sp. HG249]
MLDYLSLAISAVAVLLALPIIPNIERARLAIVMVALGCGQIYIAILAFGFFMLAESKWRLSPGFSNFAYLWGFMLLLGIGVTTAVVPTTGRTYNELAQLGMYVVLTLLTLTYLRSGEHLYRFLSAALIGSIGVAMLALASVLLGIQSPPSIFLARGANEGSIFLSLMGAVPAAILFVRSRNPFYILCLLLFVYVQYLATARGSLIVSGIAGLAAVFFVTRVFLLRAALIAIGLYLVINYTPLLNATYESNLNFSARERLALAQYGYWLWEQRPITGWGWGSTTYLAESASTTELVYPHFHNSYIQLMVEAGVIGLLIIATFVLACVRLGFLATVRYRQPAISVLVVTNAIALVVSGMFDAMLYGADRAIQVIILLSLMYRAIKLASEEQTGSGMPAAIEAPASADNLPAPNPTG